MAFEKTYRNKEDQLTREMLEYWDEVDAEWELYSKNKGTVIKPDSNKNIPSEHPILNIKGAIPSKIDLYYILGNKTLKSITINPEDSPREDVHNTKFSNQVQPQYEIDLTKLKPGSYRLYIESFEENTGDFRMVDVGYSAQMPEVKIDFISNYFKTKNNRELNDILNGQTIIYEDDSSSSYFYSENKKGEIPLSDPVHIIKTALVFLGYVSHVPEFGNMSPFEPYFSNKEKVWDTEILWVDYIKEIQNEFGIEASGSIDSATIQALDILLFKHEISVATQFPDVKNVISTEPEEEKPLPVTDSYILLNPLWMEGEEKVKIYRSNKSNVSVASAEILAEVPNYTMVDITHEETKDKKEWYKVNFEVESTYTEIPETTNEMITGYVRHEDICWDDDEIVRGKNLKDVNVTTDRFRDVPGEFLDRIGKDIHYNFYGDPFIIKTYWSTKEAKDDERYIEVQLHYAGSGFSDARYVTITIKASDLGLNKHFFNLDSEILYNNFWFDINQYTLPVENTQKITISINNNAYYNSTAGSPTGRPDHINTSFEIEDKLEHSDVWIPTSNIHNFSVTDEKISSPLTFNRVNVVKPQSRKIGDNEGLDLGGFSIGTTKKMDISDAYEIALDIVNELSEKTKNEGKTMNIPVIMPNGRLLSKQESGKIRAELRLLKLNKTISEESASQMTDIMLRCKEGLLTMVGYALFLPKEEIAEKITPELEKSSALYREALLMAPTNQAAALEKVKLAIQSQLYLERKKEALLVQSYGFNRTRLNNSALAFFKLNENPAFRSSTNTLLDQIINDQLAKVDTYNTEKRKQLFQRNDDNADIEAKPEINLDQLVGMIDLVCVHFCFEEAMKAYKEVGLSGPGLRVLQVTSYGTEEASSFGRMIDAVYKAYTKPQITSNYEITKVISHFYGMIQELNVNGTLESMYSEIDEERKSQALQSAFLEIFLGVVAFVIAEILTLGAATALAPAFVGLSVRTGFAASRLISAFRTIGSITLFTGLNSMGQYARYGEFKTNFLSDLFTNFLMFGALRLTTGAYDMLLTKIADKGYKVSSGAQVAGHHLVALSTLQGFAELHHYAETGEWMNADQRIFSALNNVGLHFAMQLAGAVVTEPWNKMYGKVGAEIANREMVQFESMVKEMETLRGEIGTETKTMADSKTIGIEFSQKLARYFELQQAMFEKMYSAADAKQKKELNIAREQQVKRYQTLTDKMKLEMAAAGIEVRTPETSRFEIIGKDRVAVDRLDFEQVRTMLEKTGQLETLVKGDLYKLTSYDGKVLYILLKTGPRSRVYNTLGSKKAGKLTSEEIDYLGKLKSEKLKEFEKLSVEEIRQKITQEKQNNAKFEEKVIVDGVEYTAHRFGKNQVEVYSRMISETEINYYLDPKQKPFAECQLESGTFKSAIEVPEGLRGEGIGKSTFMDAFNRFKANTEIKDILGDWTKGSLGTNYEMFYDALLNNLTPKEAAFSTKTGQWAKELGFSEILEPIRNLNLVKNNNFPIVNVYFIKPK